MYIAIQIVARLDAATPEEREQLEHAIVKLLGCDDTEDDCPMVLYMSTTAQTAEAAIESLR
jgi:hypothetical protein